MYSLKYNCAWACLSIQAEFMVSLVSDAFNVVYTVMQLPFFSWGLQRKQYVYSNEKYYNKYNLVHNKIEIQFIHAPGSQALIQIIILW